MGFTFLMKFTNNPVVTPCRATPNQPLSRGLANTGAEETRQEDKKEERE
jgi:hypothetical protein